MAITLGQLRTYCQEIASKDANGSTAEREFMHWINSAEERLYLQPGLDATRREVKITTPPAVTNTDGVTTQNSLVISSATGWLAVYVSERWGIIIEGESRLMFEGATINGGLTQITLRAGDEWILASGTALDITVTKDKYLIPTLAAIFSVRTADGREVAYLDPAGYDLLKSRSPTHQSDVPLYCTYRNDYLEIWPAPSTTYGKLTVTHRVGFTPHASAAAADGGDADATTVIWPDRFLGVLKKAILVESALSQGTNAPVPYPIALSEFQAALAQLQENGAKETQPGPLSVCTPIMILPGFNPRRRWVSDGHGTTP